MSQIKRQSASRFSLSASMVVFVAAVIAASTLFSPPPALAASGPVWSIQSAAVPTNMQTADAVSAVQQVRVAATGGTFTLTLEGQTTAPIAYNANAADVASALDALSSVGGFGGRVSVTGGPGDEAGSSAYVVTFDGTLRGVPEVTGFFGTAPSITADSTALSGGEQTATVSLTTKGSTNDEYDLHVENYGDASSSGAIIVTDKLPPGVTTTQTSLPEVGQSGAGLSCSAGAGLTEVVCTGTPEIPAGVTQSYNSIEASVEKGTFTVAIPVTVAANASGSVRNVATVSGGGAATGASASPSNPLNSSAPPAFGVSYLDAEVNDEAGAPLTQAGGHPSSVTVNFAFNMESAPGKVGAAPSSVGNDGAIDSVGEDEPREIAVDLPLGLVGNPLAAPRCPLALAEKGGTNLTNCPRDTEVGIAYLGFFAHGPSVLGPYGVFNIVPEAGRPGEFLFDPIAGAAVVLYGSVVRTALGNVVRVVAQAPRANFHSLSIAFFGNPIGVFAQKGEDEEQLPFLINPTDCQASEAARTLKLHVDSWYHPGALNADGTPNFSDPNWKEASTVIPPVEGCNLLEFNPSQFELAPRGLLEGTHSASAGGTTQADEPSAYEGRLKIPQVETFGTLSRPELKNATVTLPAGVSVSPSAANGLEGCSEAQLDPGSGEPGKCPDGSELGTVEVTTPLLSKPLQGHVYLAEPKCGEAGQPQCSEADAEEGRLFGLDMELDGEAVIKLPGSVEAGGYGAHSRQTGLQPGQLRAVFANNPQLPFSELAFKFKEGPRTPIANPQTCGTYTTNSVLEPWSAPFSASASSQSPFGVDWDGRGAGCPGSLPFNPSFTAGTASPAAGAYSPLDVEFTRQDREQDLSQITVRTPTGVLGNLSTVPLCAEAQANAGTCGAESQIGTTSAVVGPGEHPFSITGGRVYLTGPYKGAPFGLSIVVPAVAGPFHLGNVVVRASIAIDPHTSALTVTSNALPQVIDGVPLRLRAVNVDVNRPGFTFNATKCTQQRVEATLTGLNGFNASSGSSASVFSPYAAQGCERLPFAPSFSVATQGNTTSKKNGASLNVKLQQKPGEANIQKVDVTLPLALPARLTTLQKACTEAQFNANPAGCPSESNVGIAVAHTPVLPVPLVGPAYLVSHGGAAFPDLVLVLQGDGVTIDLVGNTQITKGLTYSKFETVPDAPIDGFELNLPEGPYSVLAANKNLCEPTKTVTVDKRVSRRVHGRLVHVIEKVKKSVAEPLVMPTTITAQNGAVLQQTTKVLATGCAAVKASKAKKLTRAQQLKKALKACKRKRKKGKRAACEKQARKRYGPKKKKSKRK